MLKGKTLLAYTAGIIDGEGCITLSDIGVKHKPRYYLRVSVGMTNEWLPQFLKFNFGGSVCLRKAKSPKHKDCWILTVNCTNARKFLELVTPYLQIKKPQGELALTFQSRKKDGVHPNSNQKVLEEADKILMSSYNKRGKITREVI